MPDHTEAERKKKSKPGIVASLAARSRALAELGVPGTFATAERLEAEKGTREAKKKKKNSQKNRNFRSPRTRLNESPFK